MTTVLSGTSTWWNLLQGTLQKRLCAPCNVFHNVVVFRVQLSKCCWETVCYSSPGREGHTLKNLGVLDWGVALN